MKKILIYLSISFCIIFILPSIFTKRKENVVAISEIDKENVVKEETSQTEPKEETEEKKYEYTNYANIKLYHSKTNEVEEIPIDEYLYGVVSSEMPASYNIEALKAQAVVARTYTVYQIKSSKGKHVDSDICDNYACCQAWISKEDRLAKWEESERDSNWAKIVEAVDATRGKIITYNGEAIDAFFHSNSGGITEIPTNVWGGTNFPYLQSVQTSGEDEYSQYNSEVELTKEELVEKIKTKHSDISINFDSENSIEILEYTDSGRVRTIKFGNIQMAGTEARTLLGLKSTNFSFEINENTVKFTVIGYGHGVGMSQTGADSMAKNGSNYEDIIKHFYTGIEITYL